MLEKLYLFSFLFAFTSFLSGQSYLGKVNYFGPDQGLSHRDVQCIHQDKEGLLWLGTKDGLNRFDGRHFKWYTKETHGLQTDEVNFILEDKQGLMWLVRTGAYFVKTVKSIDIFNPKKDTVIPFEDFFQEKPPFSLSDIVNFISHPTGTLLFLTKDGEFVFYDGKFQTTPASLGAFEAIRNINFAPNGWIWLTAGTNPLPGKTANLILLAFDENGQEVRRVQHSGFDFGFIYDLDDAGNCKYLISKKIEDGSPRLQAFYTAGNEKPVHDKILQSKLSETGREQSYLTNINHVWRQDHQLWISAENNFDATKLPFDILALSGEINVQWDEIFHNICCTTSRLIDNVGRIWVGTQFGLYQIRLKENHFSKITNHNEKGFTTRGMMDVAERLWIVEENAFNLWEIPFDAIKKGSSISAINHRIPFEYPIFTLDKDSEGNILYINTNQLVRLNPHTYAQKVEPLIPIEDFVREVWAIYECEDGKLWFTTLEGRIGCKDEVGFRWISLPDSAGVPGYIYQFLKDQNGKTWLITNKGLLVLNTKKGAIEAQYWSGGKDQYYFPYDNLYHGFEAEDGAFWLGSGGDGLIRWEQPGKPEGWQQFTKTNGLSNNTIYAVYPDDFNNLWLSTDFGIIRFNMESQNCQAFLEADGITNNEFNRISHYQTKNGQLFFGGLNGVTTFHPRDFQENSSMDDYSLVLTDYQHYDENGELVKKHIQAISQNNKITLQPNDRYFILEFALLSFIDADKIQYAYQIEGSDKDWTYQKENYIRFSRLPYGEYTLRIKGQTASGHWSKNELAIKLLVLKPFYLQNWFLILAAITFFGGALIFYNWRVSSLKAQRKELEKIVAKRTQELVEDKKIIESQNETLEKQAKELQSLERLKSRFFANVSHELRTPLSLLLGPVDRILKDSSIQPQNRKLLQFAQRNANQLLKLINEILDLSKLEAGKLTIKEEPVHFHKYLTELLAQFHSFADSESVKFSINYDAHEALQILIDKDKVEKIIQNYLSNALKYSPPKSQVLLTVEESESQIKLSVQDSGAGIHPEDVPYIFDRFYQSKKDKSTPKGGTGIGLSLVKELAELLGGRVWAESILGEGSVFYFEFPKTVVSSQFSVVGLPPDPLKGKPKSESSNVEPDGSPFRGSGGKPVTDNRQPITVLLVEDNPDLREYIKMLLSDYEVITAENGQKALEILNQQTVETTTLRNQNQNEKQTADCGLPTVDLIISDLMMPVMDGFEFLENVKANDQWRHIPVIMLTAKVNVKAKLNALRIGVDDYLTKPFVEEELQARVRNLLHNYNQRMQLFAQNGSPEKLLEARPVIAKVDAEWLEEVETIFNKFLSDGNFKIDLAAHHLNISLRQFQRRIKQVTGLAAHQYLLEMRLQKTKDHLTEGKYSTVKEVAYSVGFRDAKHFSSTFKKRFGLTPSEYFR